MNRRLRIALASQAYDAGIVRIADRNLAGFDHVAATRHGLFAVNHDTSRLIVFGLFYGVTVRDNTIYAFEACDQPRNHTHRGRIIRLHRDGDTIVASDVFASGLDNGCHQIDFIDDRLCVLDTYNQQIVSYPVNGGKAETFRPVPCTEDYGWAGGYAHINSLIARDDEILLMLHNGADKTEMPSEIGVLDREWRLIRREPLAGFGCHSFAVLEDRTLLACGSGNGELLGSNGLKLKICDQLTRGLSVDATQVVVGGSTFSERDLRDEAGGAIYFLDRDYKVQAKLAMPAPTMEIRRIDGYDRSLSSFLATVADQGAP